MALVPIPASCAALIDLLERCRRWPAPLILVALDYARWPALRERPRYARPPTRFDCPKCGNLVRAIGFHLHPDEVLPDPHGFGTCRRIVLYRTGAILR